MTIGIIIYLLAGLLVEGIFAELKLFGQERILDPSGEYEEPLVIVIMWPIALLLLWKFGDPYKED